MTRDEAIERIRRTVSKENQANIESDTITGNFGSYAEMIGGVRAILDMLANAERAKKEYRDNKR